MVRRSVPVWPFVWRGLVPALGMLLVTAYALGPFAHGDIENRVYGEVRSALDLRGFQWVRVDVSGQDVTLSGASPTSTGPTEAMTIAAEAVCPTWWGRSTCATAVIDQFGKAPPPSPVVASPLTRSPSVPVAPAREESKAAAVAASPPSAAAVAPKAVAEATPLQMPVVAPSSPAGTPRPSVAARDVAAMAAAAKACEADIKALMRNKRLEFETGDSKLTATNGALLDNLAKAVKSCPGVVRVEGHTDAVGGAADNQKLSLARAFAVRDVLVQRGLPPSQLIAEGFGESKPTATNKTADGRAKNRRIEFRALVP